MITKIYIYIYILLFAYVCESKDYHVVPVQNILYHVFGLSVRLLGCLVCGMLVCLYVCLLACFGCLFVYVMGNEGM